MARGQGDDESFRTQVRQLAPDLRARRRTASTRRRARRFARHLHYLAGELDDPATYAALRQRLTEIDATLARRQRAPVLPRHPAEPLRGRDQAAGRVGLAPRVPDPEAAAVGPHHHREAVRPEPRERGRAQRLVRRAFAEHQVYRIDHYLGKETVQNLLVFRFANSIFEPIWNRPHVHHVQITAAESVGVEHRGKYYEEAGVVRDMFQNHLLQLLSLMAMEPPVTFSADAVRDEKVKVLRAIRPITPAVMHDYSVRGQYGPGTIDGKPVPGYRQEPDVAPDSATPTYARDALHDRQLALARRAVLPALGQAAAPAGDRDRHPVPEAAARDVPAAAGRDDGGQHAGHPGAAEGRDRAAVRGEGARGATCKMASVDMDFGYAEAFGELDHDAYETLLLDCMLGEATLFTRSDEVEAAWSVVDPIIDYWAGKRPEHFPNYAAGTWGPEVAARVHRAGRGAVAGAIGASLGAAEPRGSAPDGRRRQTTERTGREARLPGRFVPLRSSPFFLRSPSHGPRPAPPFRRQLRIPERRDLGGERHAGDPVGVVVPHAVGRRKIVASAPSTPAARPPARGLLGIGRLVGHVPDLPRILAQIVQLEPRARRLEQPPLRRR